MKSLLASTPDRIVKIPHPVVVGSVLTVLSLVVGGFAGAAAHSEVPLTYFFRFWMIALGAFNWVSISNILFVIHFRFTHS